MHRTSLSLLAAVCATPLIAQTQISLPDHADIVDGQHWVEQPFGTPGFRSQILIAGSAVGPNGAVLNSIAFRPERPYVAAPAVQIPNVTVTLSHTTVALGSMSDTFGANVTDTTTVVFQGTVSLPAVSGNLAGPQPWNIVIPFTTPYVFTTAQGNLLVEIVGNNPAGGQPNRWLDCMVPGGSANEFGVGGDNATFDNLFVGLSVYNANVPRTISPGNTFDFWSALTFSTTPGVLALGTAALPVPLDLTPFGAPTNRLYIDPILLSPHNWMLGFLGYYSTYTVQVPNNPVLVDATLYAQSAIFETSSNALGLVLSPALEIRLGDPLEPTLMQQVNANDPGASSGTVVDFGIDPPSNRQHGAVPVRFDGVFF